MATQQKLVKVGITLTQPVADLAREHVRMRKQQGKRGDSLSALVERALIAQLEKETE